MKKSLARIVFAASVNLAIASALFAAGGRPQPSPKPTAGDGTVIRWQIELRGGVRARLMAQPGEMVQVTRQDGTTVGMLPRLGKASGASPSVTFEIYEVFGDPRKGEKQRFRRVDTVEAQVDQPALAPKVADLSLTLKGIEKPRPESAAPVKKLSEGEGRHIIRWSVVLPDGGTVKMAVVAGDTALLRLSDGRAYGLQPSVGDDGRVTFQILGGEQTKALRDTPSSRLLERFTLEPGAEYFPSTLAVNLLQITDVREIAGSEVLATPMAQAKEEIEAGCCVTCSGTRACACSVSMDCGDCCVPPCCAWVF